jgi:GntR family transcriptional regulator
VPLVRDPIYHQLNRLLRGLLRSGEFATGQQFLTERQVSQRFEVSRATANKALSNLVAEGVLEFRKGVGTFVRGAVLGQDLGALVSFTSKARAAGLRPTTRVLAFRTIPAGGAGPEVCSALEVGPSEPLFSLARLRLASAVPVILERRFVVARLCPRLSRKDATGSLYRAWTETHGLEIAGARQTIRAVTIAGEDRRLLAAPRASAGLLVVAVGLAGAGQPLWWERTLYRGDAYEFVNRLGPLETARPAEGALLDPTGRARPGRPGPTTRNDAWTPATKTSPE